MQDFYPTPGTVSTCMYYTGLDPLTMNEVYVADDPHEKAMQRALIQYRDPKNHALVREALRSAHRFDLIGYGPECLVPPERGAGNGRNADARNSGSRNSNSQRSGSHNSSARNSDSRTSNSRSSNARNAGSRNSDSRTSNSRSPNARNAGSRRTDSRSSGSRNPGAPRSGRDAKTGSPTHSKKQRRKK